MTNLDAVALSCQNSSIGKLLPNALYVHVSAIERLDPLLQDYERQGRVTDKLAGATLVKFALDRPKISYLFYPDFDRDPHPSLHRSLVVDMASFEVKELDYADAANPPILHRKEIFVAADYPLYQTFAHLTHCEETLGLLDNARAIGTRQGWQQRLNYYGITFIEHYLACPLKARSRSQIQIERHKAAISRVTLSRPVRLALEAELFSPETSFFDYGCGYGKDIEYMAKQGYASSGWDPHYHPHTPCSSADIVNLGYVINVIEDPRERQQALLNAWELTRQVLIVSAQVLIDDRDRGVVAYGDGIVTSRNTFQKYYEQEELKTYIDRVLGVDAIPAGLGVYFIFRDENRGQAFRLSRFRSRLTTPRIRQQVKRFEDYETLLTPLLEFMTQRGRLPVKGELANDSELRAEFRSPRRAFQIVLQVTDPQEWEEIAQKRSQDLLLYLALSKFSHRPKIHQLDVSVREDIKAFFGSYQQACLLADMMLFSLRDLQNIADLCRNSSVGKRLKNALLIHTSALESLPPLLRLYEGCASRTVGRLESATSIEFSFRQPQISYLYYPDFDANPHPSLQMSMEISLSDLQVRYRDFSEDDNPPILLEKDKLVDRDYPLYEKFARLTQQERDWGLLDDFKAVSRLRGWRQTLEDRCAVIKGHKVGWSKDADPYKVKLLRSQIAARQKKRKQIQRERALSNETAPDRPDCNGR